MHMIRMHSVMHCGALCGAQYPLHIYFHYVKIIISIVGSVFFSFLLSFIHFVLTQMETRIKWQLLQAKLKTDDKNGKLTVHGKSMQCERRSRSKTENK